MKYYIIAGEASGDLHGSNLIKEIKKLDQQAQLRAWGGDLMEDAGADIVKHYRDLAFMGFTEVIKNLPAIFSNIKFCKSDILLFQPDIIILIDYPGFNLRIASWAKSKGFRIIYYISPQVWAWKENRVHKIRKVVDRMLVILPFEKEFYRRHNYLVSYVGHPLLQVIDEFIEQHHVTSLEGLPVIALLPGSRRQEVVKKLPIMLAASKAFPQHRFVIAKASSLDDDFYNSFLKDYPEVETVRGQTYGLLANAAAALVTSGTATLETALFGVPQVVCYKGSPISYQIAKRLVKVKYISLVNLILDKMVVRELIQEEMTVVNVISELNSILNDTARKAQVQKDYTDLKELLQQDHYASERAAREIIDFMKLSPQKKFEGDNNQRHQE